MARQGSARVTLKEIDLSQVRNPQQLPQGVPAAVVGPARKGPAFVPRTFANMQQFEEVFGSMLTRGRLNNSNLYGPLALNEWMRSASAGTYLRVLGVGDGNPSVGGTGRVTDAGFNVGTAQVHPASGTPGKVSVNPYANITDETILGRTNFLGCFMKDSTGSNYLKDAGMEAEGAAASIVIEFGALPEANDTIKLDAVDSTGNLSGDVTFTFGGGVAIGANVVATLASLKAAIEADGELGNAGDHRIIVSAVEDVNGDQSLARITLTSAFPEALDSTNDCVVKFNINPTTSGDDLKIKVGDKTASVTDATFNFAQSGGSGAKCVISVTDVPADGSRLELISLNNDNVGGLTSASVVYEFKSASVTDTDQTSGETGRYSSNESSSVFVDASGTKVEALANLKAALDRAVSNHTGKYATSISEDGLTLTVTQKQKGLAGRADHSSAANVKLTAADSNLQISVGSNDSQETPDAVAEFGTDRTEGFFFGGSDADSTSFTMTLTGQPNDNDFLTICMLDNDGASEVFENFVFETFANKTGTRNGSKTGTPGTAAGPNLNGRDPDNNFITVLIGDDLQETLYNLKNAIRSSDTDNAETDLLAEVSDETDSITISLAHGGGKLLGVMKNVVNISDVATFTNPAGETLTGNYGEKSENFSGGGGAATPVIRGVLMTPQGVSAKLALTSAAATATGLTNTKPSASLDLATSGPNGYSVGSIGSDQSFKIFLNGHKDVREISASFDPDNSAYFAKVLNTDPAKIEELGHYLYAWWDIDSNVAAPSEAGLLHAGSALTGSDYAGMQAFLVTGADTDRDAGSLNYEAFTARYQHAKTPWLVSQSFGGKKYNLFKLHALDDGEISNGMFRLLVSNLRYESRDVYGRFDLSLERLDTNPLHGDVIVSWKNLSLDPDDRNFVARVIGTQHTYYDFESVQAKQRLKVEGLYPVRNSFVRLELSDELAGGEVPVDALPTGFLSHSYLKTAVANNFIEDLDVEAKRVFTDSANQALDILSTAQVAPIKFVRSVSRSINSTTRAASSDLAWGVKFAKKEFDDSGLKELSEIINDDSIKSYAKYFPHFNDVFVEDDGTSEDFQNGRFSLEKIQIPEAQLSSDEISDWADSVYRRDGVLVADSNGKFGRFVNIAKDAQGKNVRFLKFRCMFQGGFDGVNIFDTEKAELTGVASLREGDDERAENKYTGPTVVAYQRACDVLADKSAVEFQVLALPGQRAHVVTDYAVTACEERFDALYIMDIIEKDPSGVSIEDEFTKPHVRQTISNFELRNLDSSFGAAYFPDVTVARPADGAAISVPPSVGVLGVLSRNDSIAAPWFAPAGLNRGRVASSGVRIQMNRDLLDELYDVDINPIYEPAGRAGEVYVFGQKTLLQDQSALDRINVRRLLIDIRRKVKKIGESLLFEPNRASTLSKFSSLVEPIMKDVQKRQGVARYKVQIDSSTTTQNDIENNTIRGKIYLQPLKSIEFISLDFVVTNTIE